METNLDLQNRKKAEAASISSAIGAKQPGSPVSSPDDGIASGLATPPKTILINGIPHQNLPDQKFPGPLSMMANAAGETIKFAATAPFSNRTDDRLAANRRDLNNDTAAPNTAKPVTPASIAQPPAIPHAPSQELRPGFDKGGLITAESAASAMGGPMTRTGGIAGGIDMAGVNAIMARENATRQSMIDSQRTDSKPGSGIAILGDGGIEAANTEKTARWRQDELISQASRGNQGAIVAAMNAGPEMAKAGIAAMSDASRNAAAMRSQDIQAQNEAARLAGNPADNQLKQAQAQGIAATTENTRQQAELRDKLLTETDPAKRSAMQDAMLAAQGRDINQGRYSRLGGGEQVIDPLTGQKSKMPDQVFDSRTGKTVQPDRRELSNQDFDVIGKKIGLPAEALKTRYEELKTRGPITRLDQFDSVDVALSVADGTKPETIAATIKRLGGNPADYGL